MYSFDTSKEDKDFLECLFGRGGDLNTPEVSDRFIGAHNQAKNKLREMMGGTLLKTTVISEYTSQEKFDLLMQEVARDMQPEHRVHAAVFTLIRRFVERHDGTLSLIENMHSNGTKLTRWLPKQAAQLAEDLNKYHRDDIRFLDYSKFQTSHSVDAEWATTHVLTPFLNVYTTYYLPRIQKKEITVVVSTRLEDFLLMSEHGIHSCHSVLHNNIHSAGPFALAVDHSTVVAYAYSTMRPLDSSKYSQFPVFYERGKKFPFKIWRMLMYVNVDGGAVVLSRHYPTTRDDFSIEARKLLMTKMCGYANMENKWIRSRRYSHLEYGSHLSYRGDEKTGQVTITELYKKYKELVFPTILVGGEAPCPLCGEHKLESCGAITCGNCKDECSNGCSNCGQELPNDYDRYTAPDGDLLCRECFYEDYFVCSYCGSTGHNEDSYYGEDEYYCDTCFDRLFFTCDSCDEAHLRQEQVSVTSRYGDSSYCQSCASDHTVSCSFCETLIDEDFSSEWSEVDDNVVCSTCLSEYYFECSVCSDIVHVDDMVVDSNGFEMCPSCVEEDEEEEGVGE